MGEALAFIALAFIFLGVLCVAIQIGLAIAVPFLMTLHKALGRCAARSRTMASGLVWLNLVPILNLYWIFHTAINIGRSLKNEFVFREFDDGGDYGKTLGIWMASTYITGSLVSNASRAAGFEGGAIFGGLISFASLILFIVYWVRIYGYSNRLKHDDESFDRRDFDRDRHDDLDDDLPPLPRSPGPTVTDISAKPEDNRYS